MLEMWLLGLPMGIRPMHQGICHLINVSPTLRQLIALLIPFIACSIQLIFWESIYPYAWLLFYPAVFLSSWIGGKLFGIISTVVSVLLVWWLFMIKDFSVLPAITIFIGMGVVFSFFHECLHKARSNADAANLAKSVFLTNMSHEIRTPMNAVLGFTQLLLRNPQLPPSQQVHLETIYRSGEHLLNVINNILEMSRIESAKITLNPESFDLLILLDDMEQMFSLRAVSKQVNFSIKRQQPLLQTAVTDATKLRQVLINLLGNAIKFTPNGGSVKLLVNAKEEHNERWRLFMEVEDSGPGISNIDLPNLFKPFFQTAIGSKHYDSTGLGLAISREYIKMMGGELNVTSRIGVGTVFRFNVLLDAPQTNQAVDNRSKRVAVGLKSLNLPCRILIADDDPCHQKFIKELLETIGFDLRIVSDGADAVKECAEWKPQVVLLDIKMPIMDGFETIHRIRQIHGNNMKIIVVSAIVFKDQQQKALEMGADIYLCKPIIINNLLASIKELTGFQYLYDDQDDPNKSEVSKERKSCEVSSTELQNLPSDLVSALYNATETADYDKMLIVINKISKYDSNISRRLLQYAENYEYFKLLNISRPSSPEQ